MYNLSYEEKQRLVRRILTGKLFVYKDGEVFRFKDPTVVVLAEAEEIYRGVFEEIKDFRPTIDETINDLIRMNMWTQEQQDELDKLYSDLKFKKLEESNNKRNAIALAKTKALKNVILEKIEKLTSIKNQFYKSTAEYAAKIRKRNFLIEKIIDCDYTCGIGKMLKIYFEENNISTEEIRIIARSEPWRTLWKTSKSTGTPLISNIAENTTEYQYLLFHWSQIYDYVYESSERPDNLDISDDVKVDQWLETIEKKTNKKKVSNFKHGDISITENFSFAKNKDEARSIYSGNDEDAKKHIKSVINSVSSGNSVEDIELPHIKQEAIKILKEKSKNG